MRQGLDTEEIDKITVRLEESPDRLNPILSKTQTATQIENLILLSAAEYDPIALELRPVLIEKVPVGLPIAEGDYEGETLFQMKFRPEAKWEDGSSVTAEDYEFTLKVIFNPLIKASWRNILSGIKKVYIDPDDKLTVGVVVSGDLVLSQEVACNFNIYPKYNYDPQGLLDDVPLDELLTLDEVMLEEKYPQLRKFAELFTSDAYSREKIVGSGPYRLESWSQDLAINLVRKDNYWGRQFTDESNYLQGNPARLVYRIIEDENTAMTALKQGELDVMANISPLAFGQLQAQELSLKYYTPQVMSYYYIGMNGNDLRLEETAVRQAMAHLLDIDQLIETLMAGLAVRTVGPIHPSKSYYNRDLSPVAFDIDRANQLLDAAGWKDSDGDGIRDKRKYDKLQSLDFVLKTSPRELGKNIALILKENAAKAGVNITIESKEFRSILGDIRKGDFHFANLVARQYPGMYDPYSSWHTDNIGDGGRNYMGFGSEESDELIKTIRTTVNVEKREQAYREFQRLVHEQQPAIFLFSPVERIASQDGYNLPVSSQRPGYFENSIVRNSSQ